MFSCIVLLHDNVTITRDNLLNLLTATKKQPQTSTQQGTPLNSYKRTANCTYININIISSKSLNKPNRETQKVLNFLIRLYNLLNPFSKTFKSVDNKTSTSGICKRASDKYYLLFAGLTVTVRFIKRRAMVKTDYGGQCG